jgi:hypothetical protein
MPDFTAVSDTSMNSAQPPVARREPKPITMHGVTLDDDYGWMRDKSSPETLAYLEAENVYTAALMSPTADLQAKLYSEMLSHIKETDESVPYRLGGWFYSTRTLEGSQYPIHCRRPAANSDLNSTFDPSQSEQIILNVNALAEGKAFMSVGSMAISPDGNLLAYSTDPTGYRQYTLHIRDLRIGADLPDTAERVGSLVWAADSRTLFYSTEDETTKRQDHIFRHQLSNAAADDTLVLHEQDERFNIGIGRTRDGRYLMIEAGSHTTNEYRFLDAANPTGEFRVIAPRHDDQEYYPDHRDGLFFIRVNDTGKNFRVVTASPSTPGREHWVELIALDPIHPLEDFDLFESFAVTTHRKLGLPTLEVLRFTDATLHNTPGIRSLNPGAPSFAASSLKVGSTEPAQPTLAPTNHWSRLPRSTNTTSPAPTLRPPSANQSCLSNKKFPEASIPLSTPLSASGLRRRTSYRPQATFPYQRPSSIVATPFTVTAPTRSTSMATALTAIRCPSGSRPRASRCSTVVSSWSTPTSAVAASWVTPGTMPARCPSSATPSPTSSPSPNS